MDWHEHHCDILCFTHKTEGVFADLNRNSVLLLPQAHLLQNVILKQRSIQRCLNVSSLKTTEQFSISKDLHALLKSSKALEVFTALVLP